MPCIFLMSDCSLSDSSRIRPVASYASSSIFWIPSSYCRLSLTLYYYFEDYIFEISWFRLSIASIAPEIMRRIVATSFSASDCRASEYSPFTSAIYLWPNSSSAYEVCELSIVNRFWKFCYRKPLIVRAELRNNTIWRTTLPLILRKSLTKTEPDM